MRTEKLVRRDVMIVEEMERKNAVTEVTFLSHFPLPLPC
jgi:hypothetical protein